VSRPFRHLVLAAVGGVVLSFGAVGMGLETTPIGPRPEPWFDTGDRADVVAAYQAEFETGVPELEWRSGDERCDAGSSPADYRQASIRRVNYYRAMAGVRAGVEEEPSFSAKAQRAAMMMSAEGSLTHNPGSSFACFSVVGQEAAANSNLYLGRTGPRAVDGYIEDPGEKNVDVGHRTTILHPPTRRMGVGDVGVSSVGSSANALWVFDDRVFDEESPSLRPAMREPDRFVAWPPRGYVPTGLVHPRWSLTAAGRDFTAAEVTMFRPSSPAGEREVPLRVVNRSGATGHVPLPTIVWEPELGLDLDGSPEYDIHLIVVVTGVTAAVTGEGGSAKGTPVSYAYSVRIIGRDPGTELTVAEFLDRLGSTSP